MGPFIGSYDGVPVWLVKKFPTPSMAYPYPFSSPPNQYHHLWFKNYLTVATSEDFQHLYNNVSGALDYWARFWKKVAFEFKDFPNLLGYELINEPWCGDFYNNPL